MADKKGAQGNICRGIGSGSRTAVSNEHLISLGWTILTTGKGYRWVNPEGKFFWSSTAVQDHLAAKTSSETETGPMSGVLSSSESETDVEFTPYGIPSSSEDAFSSPEKKAPIPYNMHKR